jgi:hypothetical protein
MDSFVELPYRVFEPKYFLVGCAIWYRWVLWRGPMRSWYMSSCKPLLPAGKAWKLELRFSVHCFSLESLSVTAHYQFLQGGGMFCFHQTVAEPPHPFIGWITSAFHLTPTSWSQNIPSVCFSTRFVQGKCSLPTSCTGLCASLQRTWSVPPTWQGCSFT